MPSIALGTVDMVVVFFFNTGQNLIHDVYILARETENKRYKYGKYIVCKNAVSDKTK